MKYLLAIILLTPFLNAFAQIDRKPVQYEGIPSNEKKVVFFEDFVKFGDSWKKSNFERTSTKIEDGKCILTASKNQQMIWQDLIMDRDGYEFEVKLASVKGKEKEPLSIFLMASKDEMLTFNLKPEGNFSIVLKKRGTETHLRKNRPSVHINKESNKISVRELDNTLYFFINENLVTTLQKPSLTGYRFGVIAAPKNPVAIDYVIMSDIIKSRRNADFTEKEGEVLDKEEKSRYKMN